MCRSGSGGFPLNNTVLCLGGFDVLHWGHVDFLRQAERLGRVTVGLSSDALLARTKRDPIFTYPERRRALNRLGYEVVSRNDTDASDLFASLRPEYFVCGNDWVDRDHLTAAGLTIEFLNAQNVVLVYTPREHHMSTTEILQRVRRPK